MADAISFLGPDVVVLTEYVPSRSHEAFLASLALQGFEHVLISETEPNQNQVLIASRTPIKNGDINPPPLSPALQSNFIHVDIPAFKLELIGIRIPSFKSSTNLLHIYWDWLEAVADRVKSRPFVIAGDLNVDPRYPPRKCGHRLQKFKSLGWKHGLPEHGVSYRSVVGNHGYRLDHAFVSSSLSIPNSQYIWKAGPFIYGGQRSNAMSDHAVLVVEIIEKNDE